MHACRRDTTEAFHRHAAVAAILHAAANDLRDSARIAPRGAGPGGVIFMRDGRVIVSHPNGFPGHAEVCCEGERALR